MKRALAVLVLVAGFAVWLRGWLRAWARYNQAEIAMDRRIDERNRYEENEEE